MSLIRFVPALLLLACPGDDGQTKDTTDTGTPVDTDSTPEPGLALQVEVTGLLGDGLVVTDAGEELAIPADGTWSFPALRPAGTAYDVAVAQDPVGPPQRCTVVGGEGVLSEESAPVQVTCEAYHVAFMTSSTGTGVLSSWADAGGASGLAAADAICQAHADRAGLPGVFAAWASDDSDDAYCRVGGATGKRSALCGAASLPEAGPWVRTDGVPFAGSLDQIVYPQYRILHPPGLDEYGAPVTGFFVSATTQEGEASRVAPCGNWESEVGDVTGGSADSVSIETWGGYLCAEQSALLCLEVGPGLALPPVPAPPVDARVLFVSSTEHDGALGGLAGADAVCGSLATAAGLGGSFVAYLSDDTTAAGDRVPAGSAWVRPDGYLVAESSEALIAGDLRAPPNVTELGTYQTSYAWTGSFAFGNASPYTCAGWTTNAGDASGNRGLPYTASEAWGFWSSWPCDRSLPLYCMEQ